MIAPTSTPAIVDAGAHSGWMDTRVWYVAYGSNMAAARFRCYLEGGRPVGALRTLPGCRDTTFPAQWRRVLIPGAVYYALESLTWTGGMAFYDPDGAGHVPARAWLVTDEQFCDILSQEMHRQVGARFDVGALPAGSRVALGEGRYETLVHIGDLEGHPMVTFTCPWRADEVAHNAPSAAYRLMIDSGLREMDAQSTSAG
jgi:hypothetical protein